jgi:hypothetical protein
MLVMQALDGIRAHIERLERDLAEADALIATHAYTLDPAPRVRWPQGSVLEKAVFRHEHRVLQEKLKDTENKYRHTRGQSGESYG